MTKTYITQPFLPPLEEFTPYLEKIWLTNNGSFHRQLDIKLAEYLEVKQLSLFTNNRIALVKYKSVNREMKSAEKCTIKKEF